MFVRARTVLSTYQKMPRGDTAGSVYFETTKAFPRISASVGGPSGVRYIGSVEVPDTVEVAGCWLDLKLSFSASRSSLCDFLATGVRVVAWITYLTPVCVAHWFDCTDKLFEVDKSESCFRFDGKLWLPASQSIRELLFKVEQSSHRT